MSYASEVLADAPIAYWRLGESSGTRVLDSSGHTRTAALTGSGVTRNQGSLLLTDADPSTAFAGGWAVINPAAWMSVTALTAEAWFTVTSTHSGIILARINYATGFGNSYSWHLLHLGNRLYAEVFRASSSTYAVVQSAVGSIVVGQTYHAVLTYEPSTGTAALYLNGVSVATAALAPPLTPGDVGITIGSDWANHGSTANHQGRIDEAAVYATALSPARIAAHYQAGLSDPAASSWWDGSSRQPADLEGWWDGSAEQPAELKGWWDGSAIQPLAGSAGPPTPIPSGYPEQVLADSPLGYWRLNETAGSVMADSSGNQRPGFYQGGFTLNQAGLLPSDPKAAPSVNFTGGFSAIPHGSWATTPHVTLECLIRPSSIGVAREIIGKDDDASPLSDLAYRLTLLASGVVEFLIVDNGMNIRQARTSATLSAGGVYHLVATYDGSNLRIYLNGAQAGILAAAGSIQAGSTFDITVGGLNRYAGNRFDGRIDEVAVYGSALSAARIAAHYAATGL